MVTDRSPTRHATGDVATAAARRSTHQHPVDPLMGLGAGAMWWLLT